MPPSQLFKLSFPSKTFLIGEYAVLDKGSAVLANTYPCFYFDVNLNSALSTCDFHPESSANFLIKKNKNLFSNVSILSFSPHSGYGGFGFSSAQWNCAYWVYRFQTEGLFRLKSQEDLMDMWEYCRKLHRKQGSIASGVDALSQWMGQVCLYQARPFYTDSISWNFKNIQFAFVRVEKLHSTAKHLQNLKQKKFSKLKKISKQAVKYMQDRSETGFIDQINEYAIQLEKLGLVTKNTLTFLKEFKKNKNVIGAKGCGAMGAEIIVLFFEKHNRKNVLESLKEYPVTTPRLAKGIRVQSV